MKKLFLLLMIVLLLLCSACSNASVTNTLEEIKDSISNFADFDNKYVKMVKNGYRTNNPNLTYDKAFSAFFGAPRWKYFKSTDDKNVVEFTGDCTYQDVEVKARIQFVINEKGEAFEATHLSFNEVPQNKLILVALIEKAFTATPKQTSTKSSAPVAAKNNNSTFQTSTRETASGEFLYKGKTLTNWLGARPKGLWNEFGGAPLNSGKARGGDYRSYDGITFFINVQRDEIVSISGSKLELFTANGVTLSKDRAKLIRIFGNPQEEDRIIGGDEEGYYYMRFDYRGYTLMFYSSTPKGTIDFFEISNKR